MDISELRHRALCIKDQYDQAMAAGRGRPWNRADLMLGFVVDVGELARLVMAEEGLREVPDADDRLAHELADCLWSVLVLADLCRVDLEHAFVNTMDEIATKLRVQAARGDVGPYV
jgi:NTP pyrophosphatase (non-canonical NTP hydrolase)